MIPGHPRLKLVTREFLEDSRVPERSVILDYQSWGDTAYTDVRCKRRYKRKLIRQRRLVRRAYRSDPWTFGSTQKRGPR